MASFNIYSDVSYDTVDETLLSSWLLNLRASEDQYKPQLMNLLACLTTTSKNSSTTRTVQLLIELHNDLNWFLFEKFTIIGFLQWIERSIPVYYKFVNQYKLTHDMIEIETQLLKQPLIRINQIYKMLKKLKEFSNVDDNLIAKLRKLLELAKDKNEVENLNLDLNNFKFDNVFEIFKFSHNSKLDEESLQYFKISDILQRDYFEFKMNHMSTDSYNQFELVEVFKLKQNQIAICSLLKKGGRSLMIPLLKLNEFEIEQNDLDIIHISKIIDLNFKIELFLQCPEIKQMYKWNGLIKKLNNLPIEFNKSFNRLETLKNDKVGCGFTFDASQHEYENFGINNNNSLRKSSKIFARHNSLVESVHRSPLLDITNFLTPPSEESPVQQQQEDHSSHVSVSPDVSTVPTQYNQSTASLPAITTSKPNLNINQTLQNQSTSNLSDNSKFDKYKIPIEFEKTNKTIKKRRSIFNIFKKSNEPDFDIMVKKPSMTSLKSSSNTSFKSETSNHNVNKSKSQSDIVAITSQENSISNHPLYEPVVKSHATESMASLNRNLKQLTINTSISEEKTATKSIESSELPSPFNTTPISSTDSNNQLTLKEESLLSTSNVIKVVKNSIILSKWNGKNNKWEIIGSSNIQNNTLKFLNNEQTKDFTLAFYSKNSKIPDLFIPLNNQTKINASNAKDLQLRCMDSINENSLPITLTLRCLNVYTMNEIMDQIEKIQKFNIKIQNPANSGLKISESYESEIFDHDGKPSNSTSMSSISILQEDIMSLGMPKNNVLYSSKQSSLSTLSVTTPTSAKSLESSSSLQLQNLLLKKDIKIRLHKLDKDEDWIPVSLGKFTIYSNLTNPEFSKFEIVKIDKNGSITGNKMDMIVKNSNCSRIGKSGMVFESIDEYNGEELKYLIEFRNNKECIEIYEFLE